MIPHPMPKNIFDNVEIKTDGFVKIKIIPTTNLLIKPCNPTP